MAAKTFLILCLWAIWAVAVVHGASSSAHHAPSPSPDCSSLILNMADCLSFVSSGSTTMKPSGSCCSGFKTVLKTSPECICEAFKSSSQLGVSLNLTKAMTLPAACKLSAPSFSNCGLSVTPAGAPGMSPSSSATAPGMSGSETPSESPTGAAAPVASPGSSAPSSMVPISAGSLLVCILAAIFLVF
ncbi:hypothetical protein QN277_019959 [Acacia crassicarpa]|uniref:Bifunctional inhibitor/plant lipid transfer protein/seed storage helical domain-containing protein n=1 Tax=Acacia crassicarpa TaxID=499986 RepID=A0AAE1MKK5_9FABA|nr:hypothetical protein QN277_019959 [Acacia crassicarpa]